MLRPRAFSAIFAKRGLSLDFGTSWLLRQRIGVHKAKELVFTAQMFSGTEAFELGLVNAVVPAEELDAAVARDRRTRSPPVRRSRCRWRSGSSTTRRPTSLAQALEVEALAQSVNVHTEDLREALTAYVERRPPDFTGR